jgi:UDP-N-acetyl-D-mannosaminuronic acid dehydrogenase
VSEAVNGPAARRLGGAFEAADRDAADVAVVGLGRVGLPLALSFADRGLRVVGVERDPAVLESIGAGRMPFHETGTQEVLDRVSASGRLEITPRVTDAARADHIVLTLGTPAFAQIEIDVSQVRAVLDELLPALRPGHVLTLRSTVGPGTTEWVGGYLEQRSGLRVGEDVFVAHVPERIAENHFLEEIATLPCIVGGVGDESTERAAELFAVFGTQVVHTSPVQAELTKIWTNILRYANFALPNLLMMNCEQYGANVFEVIDLINRDYPRGGIASPGLTAGTCLRKDFAFSEERSSAPGMLLAVSRVHETVPLFLVEGLKRRLGGSLRDRRVAVLGLTFKRDSDDTRDSLSYKLVRLLERELAVVAQHDPFVPAQSEPLEEALHAADAVLVATNHSAYEGLLERVPAGAVLVDPWNVTGSGRVFAQVDDRAPVRSR